MARGGRHHRRRRHATDDGKKYANDLFFSSSSSSSSWCFFRARGNEFPPIATAFIDCIRNRSLTNESTDSFHQNVNVCVYGFKKFLLLESPLQLSPFLHRRAKEDHDKLKFIVAKICPRLMIRYDHDDEEDDNDNDVYSRRERSSTTAAGSSGNATPGELIKYGDMVFVFANAINNDETNLKDEQLILSIVRSGSVCGEVLKLSTDRVVEPKVLKICENRRSIRRWGVVENDFVTRGEAQTNYFMGDVRKTLKGATSELELSSSKCNSEGEHDSDCSITDSLSEFSLDL